MARITPQSAKNKGRRLQQWVCRKISDITGDAWGSSGDDCPIESRPMGQSGTDVRMESHVLKKFAYSIECKYQENWNLHDFVHQARVNTLPNTEWLLVCKKNKENPVVVLNQYHLIDLFKRFDVNYEGWELDSYTFKAWRIKKWLKDIKEKGNPNWIILLRKDTEEYIAMLDGELFFNLFGKVKFKMKRKLKSNERTKSRNESKTTFRRTKFPRSHNRGNEGKLF